MIRSVFGFLRLTAGVNLRLSWKELVQTRDFIVGSGHIIIVVVESLISTVVQLWCRIALCPCPVLSPSVGVNKRKVCMYIGT